MRGSGEAKTSPAASASRLTLARALKAAGFTERDLRRMRLLASLTEAEMKQASAKTCAEVVDAADRAIEREARRIIRARREAERLRLTDDERAVLRIMERDLRRPLTEQEEHLVSGAGAVARHGLSDSVIVSSQTSGISRRVMLPPGEPSTISPEREAERLRLSEDERAMLQAMERELGRRLTEPEEHLALEQARSLGMV